MTKASLILFLLLPGASRASEAPEEQFRRGLDAAGAHDYANALSNFEAALATDPDNLRYANEYRQTVIRTKEYDRSLKFFDKLVTDHPNSANAWLNAGFALIDKRPVSGAVTQAILANTALTRFTNSIKLQPTIVALYTRGADYLYWPRVFNRTPLGIADLEEALKKQKATEKQNYFFKTWVAAVFRARWVPKKLPIKHVDITNGEETGTCVARSMDLLRRSAHSICTEVP